MLKRRTIETIKSKEMPLISLATIIAFLIITVMFNDNARSDVIEDDGTGITSGAASSDLSTPSLQSGLRSLSAALSIPQAVVQGDGNVSYAAWNDDSNRNQGFVYIYPLQDDTNIELWATSSLSTPVQINNLAASWANASAGKPLSFGPLTNRQYFFKLKTDKPVTWELSTNAYSSYRDSSRFVIASSLNYLGDLFYFHADRVYNEEVNVINPGPGDSGSVELHVWNGATWVFVTSLPNITADNYGEFRVPQQAFYRITSENPVLVYEGRYYNQHMATGVTPEGDTVGDKIYAAALYDPFGASGGGVTLHIMGVTAATYTVYKRTPYSPWSVATTGSVAKDGLKSEHYLPMDMLYKIETSSPDEKIVVQYMCSWGSYTARGGGEMIPGIDDGDTTNPGTDFLLQFGGAPSGNSYTYQQHIDIIAPQSGTTVTVKGPKYATFTTTVNDQGIHYSPGVPHGVYKITSNNPIWVVLNSSLGDQQSYFVYNATTKIDVAIDIKPGSDPNSINVDSKGVIPVAILTTDEFDADTVDPETVAFGPDGAYAEHYALEDVDGDGDIDLILHFRTQDTGIAIGDTEAVLTGETYDGRKIEGSDSVRVLENKGKK